MLLDFWENFRHNLFQPLLLFFYLGFLIPILKIQFEFPYVIYQGLTLYLLLAIGWHGGEQLATVDPASIGSVVGFVILGFLMNFVIGMLAYRLLNRMTSMRRIDTATVAGYYGSDSAGTFATCIGVLATIGMTFDGYMPVMLAAMEMPGCLVALYLVGRLRHGGMDASGYMADERGDSAAIRRGPGAATQAGSGRTLDAEYECELDELEMSLERREHRQPTTTRRKPVSTAALLREVLLNPGVYLLLGGITVGFVGSLQGTNVTHDDDNFFVAAFQGALCIFLLEMGITAARHLKDLKTAGRGFIVFGLLAPNLFATLGITVAHSYAHLTHTQLQPGSYVLFAVLCGAASYIAVPAVQRLAIPEASPALPLAASLGLTFTYNVTVGIPVYIEIARVVTRHFPIA